MSGDCKALLGIPQPFPKGCGITRRAKQSTAASRFQITWYLESVRCRGDCKTPSEGFTTFSKVVDHLERFYKALISKTDSKHQKVREFLLFPPFLLSTL